MKATTRNLITSALLALLFFPSCKKIDATPKEPQMPAYTETGANTFACRVDGKVWIAGRNGLFEENLIPGFNSKGIEISAKLKKDAGIRQDMLFIMEDSIYTGGRYKFIPGKPHIDAAFWDYSVSPYVLYKYYDGEGHGELHVSRLDTINKICAGRFHFNLRDSVSGKILQITDGQFDVKKFN